jgi:hypothetical protein
MRQPANANLSGHAGSVDGGEYRGNQDRQPCLPEANGRG